MSICQNHVQDITEVTILKYYRLRHIVTSNITSTLKDAFRLATEKMPECARLIPLFPEIKSTTMPYDALDSQEALKLKKVIDNMGDNWSMRDKAITSIVYYLGLRRGDIARLRIQDVDFESDSLSFIQSKTLVRQELPLRPVVGNAIYNYIMKEHPSCDIESLFVIDDGKNIRPMTAWCVYDIMKKVFKAADVRTDGGLKGVHIFRHNLVSKLMHSGCDSLEVTAVLGHIRPESLKSYLSSDEKALKKCALDINEYPINMTAFNQYL